MKNSVHFILQGKGGVGKSFVASILTQYFQEKGQNVFCADTDPVNDTFSRYAAFKVKTIKILNGDNNIDPRVFDSLVEQIVAHDGPCVIDNGASTFVPLSSYMKENDLVNLLIDSGKKVYIHSVITGGQAMQDTLAGLAATINNQAAPIVIWENEFFGEVKQGDKVLSDFKVVEGNPDRISGVVTIHKRNSDTFGTDIEMMVKAKLTFDEALQSKDFGLMPKQRLKTVKKSIFDQLDAVEL
jgi:hypothetical protein